MKPCFLSDVPCRSASRCEAHWRNMSSTDTSHLQRP